MAKVPDRYLEERRQEILDAARRVFVEKGYAAATMNDIASEADVSAGNIYRYFENKSDLIAAAVNACVEADLDVWSTELPTDITPGEAFIALGQHTREETREPGYRDECMIRLESYLAAARDSELRGKVVPVLDESVEILAGFVRQAQQSGEFDTSIDPVEFARFLHAVGAGIGSLSVVYGADFDAASAWNQLISMVGRWFTGDLQARIQQLGVTQ